MFYDNFSTLFLNTCISKASPLQRYIEFPRKAICSWRLTHVNYIFLILRLNFVTWTKQLWPFYSYDLPTDINYIYYNKITLSSMNNKNIYLIYTSVWTFTLCITSFNNKTFCIGSPNSLCRRKKRESLEVLLSMQQSFPTWYYFLLHLHQRIYIDNIALSLYRQYFLSPPMILGTTVIFVVGTQYFLYEVGSEFSSII
jgi:hypothetical protein